jgi:hypothetical protein
MTNTLLTALAFVGLVFTNSLHASDHEVAMDCAMRLFAPLAAKNGARLSAEWAEDGWVHVREVRHSLPVRVYEAELLTRRPGWQITFSPERNCSLIGGDLNDVLGLTLSSEEGEAFTLTQYNSLVGEGRSTIYEKPVVAAQDVLRLVSVANNFVVLNAFGDIPKRKERTTRRERKTLQALRSTIAAPTVERSASGSVIVRLYSWHKWGGSVEYNTVVLHPDGRVSLSRSVLATAIGAYEFRTLM